jgi:hypothetical protein
MFYSDDVCENYTLHLEKFAKLNHLMVRIKYGQFHYELSPKVRFELVILAGGQPQTARHYYVGHSNYYVTCALNTSETYCQMLDPLSRSGATNLKVTGSIPDSVIGIFN